MSLVPARRAYASGNNKVATIFASVANEDIVVIGNDIARVKRTLAVNSIVCKRNGDLEASFNSTDPLGTEDCFAP